DIQSLTQAVQKYKGLPANANTFTRIDAIGGIGTAIAQLADDVVAIANTSTTGLPPPLDTPAFWQSFAEEVLELLLYEYLRAHRLSPAPARRRCSTCTTPPRRPFARRSSSSTRRSTGRCSPAAARCRPSSCRS